MEIRNRLFPYPVLSDDFDDYIEGRFSVDVDVEYGINEITLSFSINLENAGIQKLVNRGEAYFAIHIECSKTAYRKMLITSQKRVVFHVAATRINGDITLLGLVIAKRDIAYYKNEKLNSDYQGVDIFIPRAGIIAYQNMPKVRVTKNYEELKTSESLFTVVQRAKDNEDIHPIEFELGQEKVRILVDENVYSAYIRCSMDDNTQSLLWSLLLMPAVIYMLERLREEGIEIYEETEWYQKISASYNAQGIDFADTIANRDASITDIAQEMLRMPVGKAFDNMRKLTGGETE